jgi:hypothetical protein
MQSIPQNKPFRRQLEDNIRLQLNEIGREDVD